MTAIWPERIRAGLEGAPPGTSGVLFVDLAALRRNYRTLRDAASGAETAGVVKADAYGLGACRVVGALKQEGCRTFFVATPREPSLSPASTEGAVIYVLDGLLPGGAQAFRNDTVRPVLNSFDEVEEWVATCRSWGTAQPAAIHIDTGMTRLGMPLEDVRKLAERPGILAELDLRLILSHLACADQPGSSKNAAQLVRFQEVSARFQGIPRSLANSGGIFLGAPFHFDLVRPGIALYGGNPADGHPNPVAPVAFLYGRIAQVRWAERGETVGYGAAFTLKRRTRIATVTVGYADGYLRSLSASDTRDGPSAYIGSNALPLLGRVSMDLTTYDATDVPEELVQRGGFVEILGERITVDDLAAFAGTIGYEILTALGNRYHRVYWDAEG